MVFSSIVFIFVFLPCTLILYYLSPKPFRNTVLFLVSLVFYAWGEPVYILIMIFSTVFDYINGLLIGRFRDREGAKKAVLIDSIVVNLGILCFFKYWGFIVHNLNGVLSLHLPELNLPLPIGISFYTFQTMSYVIDVYLGKAPVQKSIVDFGTYVAMFPQLIAGPIVKYGDVAEQLQKRKETLERFGEGVEAFITGLSKKVLIANNMGLLWDRVKAVPPGELPLLSAWVGIVAFTFQIYFDFSGYSDMAVGLGKMFGFELMGNFNYPYISRSISEFWRRWHISLGSWFREYLYIPLGGNRAGRLKLYRNLFIVWFLTGLWHGANWNFMIWGLYFGVFICLERMFLENILSRVHPLVGHIYTLLIVVTGWVLFEFENLALCGSFLGVMFGLGQRGLFDIRTLYYIHNYGLLFTVSIACSTPIVRRAALYIRERLSRAYPAALSFIYLAIMIISTAYLVNDSYNPFLYFRF